MIHIEQNQIVPDNENLRVLSVTGDYADNDLIECATLDNPDFALCAFSATFIRYGGMVYQHSDPLKLGEALLAVDPESTHDAVTLFKEEEARRIKREGGDFTPENPVPADEAVSQITQEEIKEEEAKAEETPPTEDTPKKDEPAKDSPETPRGEVLGDVTAPAETSTTTPTTGTPTDSTSTSTPPIEESVAPVTPAPEVVPVTQTPPQAPAPEPIPDVPVEESMQGPVETLIESIANGLSPQE